jgi:hypothetical protein
MAKRFAVLLVTLPVLALAAGVLLPAAAAPAAPAARSASSGDTAATGVYIRANYALARGAVADLPSGRAALADLVDQIRGTCPKAAAGSPEDGESEQLSYEVIGALSVAIFRLDTPTIDRFVHAVTPLRWSDRRLTGVVRTYAAKLKGMATLGMPDVCGDVQAWASGGFRTLPTSTVSFDRRFLAVKVETEEVSQALLARYERPGEAAIVHRTSRLEGQLVEAEAQAVHDWSQILDALGLNP